MTTDAVVLELLTRALNRGEVSVNTIRHIRRAFEELTTLRAENAHLKRALALSDALRNKERNLPL